MKKIYLGMMFLITSTLIIIGCENTSNNDSNTTKETNTTETNSTNENNSSVQEYNTSISYVDEYGIDYKTINPINESAYITSQCYTKTIDESGKAHNPCYSCHINSHEPNYINDADLQLAYDMSINSKVNGFTNLFKDRTEEVNAISNTEILAYIRENNYIDSNNTITLAKKLNNVPQIWDINQNGKWDGYIPDAYFNFDPQGFDKSPDGNYTGWRAFGYYPFLGTFWPTNGSTDDVLIRLPKDFQKNSQGEFDLEVYKTNLAIVESLIKESNITLESQIDESKYNVDLDRNGELNIASNVVFEWLKGTYNPATGLISDFSMSYVGLAKSLLETNNYLIAPGLYPEGTEFLHTVRYIDIDETNSSIKMAPRMKELRYGKKNAWNTYPQISNTAMAEIKEKDGFPDRLRTILGDTENGLKTGLGWVYQGFIEDATGELRPQNYEETMYCIGCHSGIGAIADSTFVFQRKLENDAFQNGWYHWSQKLNAFKDMKEPTLPNGDGEYETYLRLNGAGDEFRANSEVIEKFFNEDGTLKQSEIETMRDDISRLIIPSINRAIALNKAYKVIVNEQSFIYGRDTHVKPLNDTVHQEVIPGESTGIEEVFTK
jgi:hypothetical protein